MFYSNPYLKAMVWSWIAFDRIMYSWGKSSHILMLRYSVTQLTADQKCMMIHFGNVESIVFSMGQVRLAVACGQLLTYEFKESTVLRLLLIFSPFCFCCLGLGLLHSWWRTSDPRKYGWRRHFHDYRVGRAFGHHSSVAELMGGQIKGIICG